MKNLAFLLLLSLASCQSSHLQIAFNESSLAQRSSGVMIKEMATGKVLFEKNADQYFMPASNTKLLSTAKPRIPSFSGARGIFLTYIQVLKIRPCVIF